MNRFNNPEPDPEPKQDAAPSSDLPEELAAAEANPLLPKIISFETLARCGDEIWIENNGQIYRLRRTKQGKLILTK